MLFSPQIKKKKPDEKILRGSSEVQKSCPSPIKRKSKINLKINTLRQNSNFFTISEIIKAQKEDTIPSTHRNI